jgi:2-keto-3-deoxy-6-phosphogluconate aldolase
MFEAYRAFHKQAFLPIFCLDGFDSKKQVESCVAAGMTGIEYTLRKPDAKEMIPWVRKNYPDLHLLVGSTLDNEDIVKRQRKKHPQLMTVAEIADLDVDGFVSMIGWSEASIKKYAKTHIIIPTAMTVNECIDQISWGADFAKLSGSDLGFVKRARGAAAFDYCPIAVTGGMTPERIPEAYEAGTAMVGTGFDLTFKGKSTDMSVEEMTEINKTYLTAAQEARAKAFPELAAIDDTASDKEWLAALPHYHHFDE